MTAENSIEILYLEIQQGNQIMVVGFGIIIGILLIGLFFNEMRHRK